MELKNQIYVTKPSLPSLDEFLPYLNEIWNSNVLTNCGPFHQKFEESLSQYLNVKYLSLFTNGTIALITALKALDISGEVITTPFSFVATAHALLWNNIKPVFVDINPDTLTLDPTKIEDAITNKTTAILPVHVYGYPCHIEEIHKIASKNKIKIVYDAAHSFGVKYKNTSIMNFGDLSVLSFHATKVFNTFEGGAIVCSSLEMKRKIDSLKNFGIQDEISVSTIGINGKMSEFNSALGLLQLKSIDEAIQQRKEIDSRYRESLEGMPNIRCLLKTNDNIVPNYAYFPILIGSKFPLKRDELYTKLLKNNIYSRRYFYPLISNFSMYQSIPSSDPANLPIANQVANGVICLPIYPGLPLEMVDFIIGLIKES